MISLNKELYDEFFVEELEKRLETDPFLTSGFWGSMPDDISVTACFCNPICELGCFTY